MNKRAHEQNHFPYESLYTAHGLIHRSNQSSKYAILTDLVEDQVCIRLIQIEPWNFIPSNDTPKQRDFALFLVNRQHSNWRNFETLEQEKPTPLESGWNHGVTP